MSSRTTRSSTRGTPLAIGIRAALKTNLVIAAMIAQNVTHLWVTVTSDKSMARSTNTVESTAKRRESLSSQRTASIQTNIIAVEMEASVDPSTLTVMITLRASTREPSTTKQATIRIENTRMNSMKLKTNLRS